MPRDLYAGSFEISPELEAERKECQRGFEEFFQAHRKAHPTISDADFWWMQREAEYNKKLEWAKFSKAKPSRLPQAGRAL